MPVLAKNIPRTASGVAGAIRQPAADAAPTLAITDEDATHLRALVRTYEVPSLNTWLRLEDAPVYDRPVALATPVVSPGQVHPFLIAELGAAPDGCVQLRVRRVFQNGAGVTDIPVQVLLAEHRSCPVFSSDNFDEPVGRIAFHRRIQDFRVHSSRVVDDPSTPANEWTDWISSWHTDGMANVWGAFSVGDPMSPGYGEHNSAVVGTPFVPAHWDSAPSVMWASGGQPTATVGPGWSRVGQYAGKRVYDIATPFQRWSELSVIYVDAPATQPIQLGTTGIILSAETRVGIQGGTVGAPDGDFVFGNPASLRRNAEGWWPCVALGGTGQNEVVLSNREGGPVDIGFLAVSTSEPTVTREEAARFLAQATFGADLAEVDRVRAMGFEAWLAEQHKIVAGEHQPKDADIGGVVAYQLPDLAPEAHDFSRVKPHMDDLWLFWEAYLKKHWNRSAVAPDSGKREDWGAAFDRPDGTDGRMPYFHQGGFNSPRGTNVTSQWARNVLRNDDQLRQRVAFALSQIFVVSNVPEPGRGMAMARYQDMLTGLAFGSFRTLLREITLSPLMARYLTYIGAIGGAADENYARELLQLFTIGLWELETDDVVNYGEPKVIDGDKIATYSNDDIEELARVFTGFYFEPAMSMRSLEPGFLLGLANTNGLAFGFTKVQGHGNWHDWGEKDATGIKVKVKAEAGGGPARMFAEVESVIDQLLLHPNVAPFFCKRMIRLLVTSNPSPAYVHRVSRVFLDHHGDPAAGTDPSPDQLFQVVRAILLDPDARRTDVPGRFGGRLLDPVVRMTRVMKALARPVQSSYPRPTFSDADFLNEDEESIKPIEEARKAIQAHSAPIWAPARDQPSTHPSFQAIEGDLQFRLEYQSASKQFGQWPYAAPSVFNFYDADYVHPVIAEEAAADPDGRGAVSPEFGMLHGASVIGFPNFVLERLEQGLSLPYRPFNSTELDFTAPLAVIDEAQQAGSVEPLYEWLQLVICNGAMGTATRTLIDQSLGDVDLLQLAEPAAKIAALKRVIWAAVISPDGAVLR